MRLRVCLDLNDLCLPNRVLVRVKVARFLALTGLLQEAGEAMTLPLRGPLLQRNLRVFLVPLRVQAVVTPSVISLSFIVALPCSVLG